MNNLKSSRIKRYRIIFYIVLFFHPFVFFHLYLAGNWYSFFHDYTLGMVFGITAFCWLCASLLLSTRIRLFDRITGQDRVLKIHGILASSGILLGIIHLLFKIPYLSFLSLQTASGAFSLFIFLLIMLMTFLFMLEKPSLPLPGFASLKKVLLKKVRIDYSIMKKIHHFFSLALVFLILHVITAFSTAENFLRISAVSIYGSTAVFRYLYFIIFKRTHSGMKKFAVEDAEALNPSIFRIRLSPVLPATRRFDFDPGQFAYFSFSSDSVSREEHPFTVSSSPLDSNVSLTVKSDGDYTIKLASLKKGDTAFLDGPYGLFTPAADDKLKLFMAGGIGITPFLSILKDWQIRGASFSAVLLWSVRSESALFDIDMIKSIAEKVPGFSFRIFVTGEDTSLYIKGRIGAADLEEALSSGPAGKSEVYICGPLPFINSSRDMALKAGTAKRSIHFESFSS